MLDAIVNILLYAAAGCGSGAGVWGCAPGWPIRWALACAIMAAFWRCRATAFMRAAFSTPGEPEPDETCLARREVDDSKSRPASEPAPSMGIVSSIMRTITASLAMPAACWPEFGTGCVAGEEPTGG